MVSASVLSSMSVTACPIHESKRYPISAKMASAVFWPMLFTRNGESGLATSVKATLVIDKSEIIICPNRAGARLFKGFPNTDMLAVRLAFQELPSYVWG